MLWYQPKSTMPAWGLLFTWPLARIPYPYVWFVWIAVCVMLVGLCMRAFGVQRRAWAVILSMPMVAGLWYGQPEALILAGVALGWLVLQDKAHPVFMGVAWMLMLLKPQVALLPAVLFALWDSKPGRLLPAVGVAFGIFVLSVFIWPQWIPNYADMAMSFSMPGTNASIWPWGLLTLPLIAWPGLSRLARLRLALAINLLASPYFQGYHSVVSLAVSGSLLGSLVSWIPVAAGDLRLAWIIPVAVLSLDIITRIMVTLNLCHRDP